MFNDKRTLSFPFGLCVLVTMVETQGRFGKAVRHKDCEEGPKP